MRASAYEAPACRAASTARLTSSRELMVEASETEEVAVAVLGRHREVDQALAQPGVLVVAAEVVGRLARQEVRRAELAQQLVLRTGARRAGGEPRHRCLSQRDHRPGHSHPLDELTSRRCHEA